VFITSVRPRGHRGGRTARTSTATLRAPNPGHPRTGRPACWSRRWRGWSRSPCWWSRLCSVPPRSGSLRAERNLDRRGSTALDEDAASRMPRPRRIHLQGQVDAGDLR